MYFVDFPLQDLAEGERSNTQTNDTIWDMLRVPRGEFEARRGKHTANSGAGGLAPPPYNDRWPFHFIVGNVFLFTVRGVIEVFFLTVPGIVWLFHCIVPIYRLVKD